MDASRGSAEAPEKAVGKLSVVSDFGRWTSSSVWVAAEWLALVSLVVSFVVMNFWPGWRTLNSDFPNHYLAARLYRQGIPLDRIYEWTWFQRQNNHLEIRDGLVGFAPNPPTSILSLVPFAALPPLAAKRTWLIFSLLFLALSLWFLNRVTSLNWRRLCLIALLCVAPMHIEFVYGRPYLLILALICGAYFAHCTNRKWTCGIVLAVAAAIKLTPGVFAILLVWKRNWRALAGLVMGVTVITAASLLMFGAEVHRVFLKEVLSQASRGDWLGPYVLAQNSFITLWSHLFLFEPELNPSPLFNSPILYAFAQACTVTVLVFGFLLSVTRESTPRETAFQWASMIPMVLLLATTTGADHPCLLIFTGIVGFDALLTSGKKRNAVLFLMLYFIACAWVPRRVSDWIPLYRLVAMTALYALLLFESRQSSRVRLDWRWLTGGVIAIAALTASNLRIVQNRAEDFSIRLPSPSDGHRSANPVPVSDGVAFTEMRQNGYEAVVLNNESFRALPLPNNVLSVASSPSNGMLYSELAGRQSLIVRLPIEGSGSDPEIVAHGQEPVLSPNGKWLAFIREASGTTAAWLWATNTTVPAELVLPQTYRPLDLSVTSEGDVIAAVGRVSDPHLVMVRRLTGEVAILNGFPHPARYPAVSPDGRRVAFSRLDRGSWHLIVRELGDSREQQLTHAWCNSISPSWQNTQALLYATDCGRGVGLSAIVRAVVP
jgi:hypothetical protein